MIIKIKESNSEFIIHTSKLNGRVTTETVTKVNSNTNFLFQIYSFLRTGATRLTDKQYLRLVGDIDGTILLELIDDPENSGIDVAAWEWEQNISYFKDLVRILNLYYTYSNEEINKYFINGKLECIDISNDSYDLRFSNTAIKNSKNLPNYVKMALDKWLFNAGRIGEYTYTIKVDYENDLFVFLFNSQDTHKDNKELFCMSFDLIPELFFLFW